MDPYLAIARRLDPQINEVAVRELTGGVSAQVRAISYADASGAEQTIVVRQHGDSHLKDTSKEAAHQQHALQEALWQLRWPVPEPLWVDASCTVLNSPFTVMAFVPGDTDYPPERLPAIIEVMATKLRELHALDTSALPALPPRLDPRPEIFDFWMPGDEWLGLRERVAGLVDTEFRGTSCLLHGDFWSGNLLWRDEQLVAILDWEDAAIGDPVCDVSGARQEMAWKHGLDAMDRLTEAYYGGPTPDPQREALWDLYCGFAGYRYMGDWGLPPEVVAYMRVMTIAIAERARAVLDAA